MTTRDEILAMAREAGIALIPNSSPMMMQSPLDELEKLVHLAQAAAYERAAKVCESTITGDMNAYASAIRELKDSA